MGIIRGVKRQAESNQACPRLFLAGLLAAVAIDLSAQNSLRIISPEKGFAVHPGESLSVDIDVPALPKYRMIALLGNGPLPSNPMRTAPPYRFTLEIPRDIASGPFQITAVGNRADGEVDYSIPVLIDVERSSRLVRISVKPTHLALSFIGIPDSLQVQGVFADGSVANITKSKHVVYRSLSPRIATVSDQGVVTGVAEGSTRITINGVFEIPVTVPNRKWR